MSLRPFARLALFTLVALSAAAPAEAQLDRIRRRVQRAAEDEAGKKAEEATRKAVRCALDDSDCAEKARKEGKTAVFTDGDGQVIVDQDGKPVTDGRDAKRSTEKPGSGAWRNYDFVPGSEVWFALDLSREQVGRFPARQLTYVDGTAQVVELDSVKVLEMTAATTLLVTFKDTLPDDFTVEFDFQAAMPNAGLVMTTSRTESRNMRSYPGHYLYLYQSAGIATVGAQVSSVSGLWQIATERMPFKLQVDGGDNMPGDYAILYGGTERVAQIPNAKFPRGNTIEFHIPATKDRPAYLANIVVAVHGDPLYEALEKEGSFTTRGILFDFDSDRLRPESTPTLEQLYQALQQHENLAVTIEGHTDGQGAAEYNRKLSERRAASVVSYLVERGIARGRLGSVGKGESVPVAGNDTEAQRQQNRRVVVVKRS